MAREFKNTAKLIKTLERKQYPWMNLVELDDKNGIWTKYGIRFGGGQTILVDKSGKILALNPKSEEIVDHLKRLLD